MSGRVFRHPQALLDLEESAVHLGRDDAGVSLRFLDAAEGTVRQLAQHPELGRLRRYRHAWLRGVRSLAVRGFDQYLVLYRPTSPGIELLRVLHGARDLPEQQTESRS